MRELSLRQRKIILLTVWSLLLLLDFAGLMLCIARRNSGTLSPENFSYSVLHFFISIFTISAIFLAELILRFRAGTPLVVCCMLFAFFGNTVSNVWRMYDFFPAWDMVLHSLSGVLFAAVGLGLGSLLLYNQPAGKLKTAAIVLFSFFFSLSVGFLWEIFEFTVDTVSPTSSTQGWAEGILESYPDGTYLVNSRRGTALLDTMEDMILHLLGSLVTLIPLFILFWKRQSSMKAFSFLPLPRRKTDGPAQAQPDAPEHSEAGVSALTPPAEHAQDGVPIGSEHQTDGFAAGAATKKREK